MRTLSLSVLLIFITTISLLGQGHIVAVGGGSESDASGSWSEESYRYIADHTFNDTLVVLSQSSESDWIPDYFRSFGVDVVHNLQISNHSVEEITSKLKTATGVFMKGGDQRDYIRAWRETSVVDEINRIYQEGGVIGGTSAGAMALSEFVSTGGPYSYENLEDPQNRFNEIVSSFLTLRPRLVFDTHYFERGRMGRLLGIYSKLYQEGETDIIGIGVDDKTAVIVDPDGKLRVSGSGGVQIFWSDEEFKMLSEKYEPLHLRRLAMHQLVDGYEIDLSTLEIVTQPERATIVDATPSEMQRYPLLDLYPDLTSDETIQQLHNSDGQELPWLVISISSSAESFTAIHSETEFLEPSSISSDEDLRSKLSVAGRVLIDLSASDFRQLLNNFPTSATFLRKESQSESILITTDINLSNQLSTSYISNLTSDDAASYYGDFATQPGINLLQHGVILDDTFVVDDFSENRLTSLPWLMHQHELTWGIWATGLTEMQLRPDSVMIESAWTRNGSRSTPAVIIDLSDGYSTAQSPFSFNSNRNKRNSVALTNARVSVIPSDVWGFPFETDPTVSIDDDLDKLKTEQPSGFRINRIYPNPFNPATTIQADFHRSGTVSIDVFSVLGKRVMKIDERVSAGTHSFELNMSARPSGVYLVKMGFEGAQVLKKITFVK